MADRDVLPRHKRVQHPPRLRLTERDVKAILAVHEYRVLRRDQIQRLLFPSKNTANHRLSRLYQHRFLARRWREVEYGQGMGQALYLLDERGADVAVQRLGIDHSQIRWRETHNHVGSPFLEHMLMVNEVRIAFTLAARTEGYSIEKWVGEEKLKASRDYVYVSAPGQARRRVAIIPDGYFVLNLGDKRAHFFLEVDRATQPHRRWMQRVRAYMSYVHSGRYSERFGTHSLRVLTVTTGPRRLTNLRRTTEEAGGGCMFWFTTLAQAQPRGILSFPVWQVATQPETARLAL